MRICPGNEAQRPENTILWQKLLKPLRLSVVQPVTVTEAKKGRMDVDPATGEELETLVKEIFDSPPEVVERVKKILAN